MKVEGQNERDRRTIHCEWCKLEIPRQDGRYNLGDLSYHVECYSNMRKGERAPSER